MPVKNKEMNELGQDTQPKKKSETLKQQKKWFGPCNPTPKLFLKNRALTWPKPQPKELMKQPTS